jgi:hypothetical protein
MAACSDWRASDIVDPNKRFQITYFVTLKIVDSYGYFYEYPGFNKDNEPGKFSFKVPYGTTIKLALIGMDHVGKKKFVLPKRRDIKAFFRHDWNLFQKIPVSGGFFTTEIWEDKPIKKKQLICFRKSGSQVLLSPEEYRKFKRPAIVISPLERLTDLKKRPQKPTSLRNIGDTSSTGKSSNSSFADLRPNKKDSNPTSSPVSKGKTKSEVIICDTKLKKQPYSFPKVPSPVIVSGLLKNIETQAYWFDPSIDTSPQNREFNLDISSMNNKFVVVEIPYNKKGKESFPVRFTGIAKVQKVSAKKTETANLNILVVGDASSIAISGLEQMEKILSKKSKKSHRKFYWTIDWRNIAANGKWQKSQKINSFTKLVSKAKLVKEKKVLLTEESDFQIFINDFIDTVLKAKKQIDFVIWVKHGYQVPLKTPLLIRKLINKIHDKGKIPRFPDGIKPRKWLYILSGSMPGKSLALLDEPISRARQRPGYVEEEKTGRSPRRLLNRPERLANIVAMRQMTPLPAKFYLDPDKLAVDANNVFSSLGLLLSVKSIDDLLISINQLEYLKKDFFAGIYDPTVLMKIQSTNTGEPKGLVVTDKQFAAKKIHLRQTNHKKEFDEFQKKAILLLQTVQGKLDASSYYCTHIYVKDREMGLNWLNKD